MLDNKRKSVRTTVPTIITFWLPSYDSTLRNPPYDLHRFSVSARNKELLHRPVRNFARCDQDKAACTRTLHTFIIAHSSHYFLVAPSCLAAIYKNSFHSSRQSPHRHFLRHTLVALPWSMRILSRLIIIHELNSTDLALRRIPLLLQNVNKSNLTAH